MASARAATPPKARPRVRLQATPIGTAIGSSIGTRKRAGALVPPHHIRYDAEAMV